MQPNQLLVIYDGDCGVCSRIARLFGRLDWRHALYWLPNQTPGLLDAVHLTPAQVAASAWSVYPTGRTVRGETAMFAALDQVLPLGAPVFSTLFRLPGLRQMADKAYQWMVVNRGRFPGEATCAIGPPAPLTAFDAAEIERRLGRMSS